MCAAAGLTERYFYESFINSEDLLTQCYRQVNADLLVAMRAAAGHPPSPVLERMRAGLLVYLEELRRHRASARLFLIEMANVSPATEALASASLDEFGALLCEIVQADPGFRGPISPLLLRGVVGGGLHIAQAWVANGCTESVEVVAGAALWRLGPSGGGKTHQKRRNNRAVSWHAGCSRKYNLARLSPASTRTGIRR